MPEKVMVVVPSLHGSINATLHLWLTEMVRTGSVVAHQVPVGRSPIAYARNVAVARFLKTNCDVLWFVDDDMTPPANAWGMIGTEADIVSSMAFAPVRDPATGGFGIALSGFRETQDGLLSSLIPDGTALRAYPVDASGSPCLLIRRHVLEDPRMLIDDPVIAPPIRQRQHRDTSVIPRIFRMLYGPAGEITLGEDLDFTYRATRLGHALLYDMRYSWGHIKRVNLSDIFAMTVNIANAVAAETPQVIM